MTRSLFVATEEGASPGLASAVQVVSDSLELGVSVGESFRFIPCEDIPGINFELIPREYGPKTDRIICMVVQPSARGSFVDAIFYHQALFPSPADNPIAAVEITKNDLKESGNMSDQRAAKFAPLKFKYPSLPCFYLIHSNNQITLKGAQGRRCHTRAFNKMLTIGVQPVFSSKLVEQVYYE
tara:strand:+ start:124 stop:669 length:546 start_codon:yes stop_codon:yes gene_type:complete